MWMRNKEFYERYTNKILGRTTSEDKTNKNEDNKDNVDEDSVYKDDDNKGDDEKDTKWEATLKKHTTDVIEVSANESAQADISEQYYSEDMSENSILENAVLENVVPESGVSEGNILEGDISDADEDAESSLNKQWYVVQTMSGKEEVLIKYIEVFVDKSYIDECFIPKRERKKKINQKWKVITEKIFKGYVFIVTSCSEKVFFALKNVPMLSKLLCDGEFTFIPLKDNEINFVSRIGSGRPDHTAKISTVEFGEGDEVIYMQGDVAAFEGMIKKFDKHRRRAIVETEMFGQKTEIWLEFEYLMKKGD